MSFEEHLEILERLGIVAYHSMCWLPDEAGSASVVLVAPTSVGRIRVSLDMASLAASYRIAYEVPVEDIPLELVLLESAGYVVGLLEENSAVRKKVLASHSCNVYLIVGLLRARLEGRF